MIIVSSVPVLVVGLAPSHSTVFGVLLALIAPHTVIGLFERVIPRVESRIFLTKFPGV